jgi:hypothetical protein
LTLKSQMSLPRDIIIIDIQNVIKPHIQKRIVFLDPGGMIGDSLKNKTLLPGF